MEVKSILKLSVLPLFGFIYYDYKQKIQGKLYFNEKNDKLKEIIQRCPDIKSLEFKPTFGFQTGLLQTIISTFLPINKDIDFKQEEIIDPKKEKIGIKIAFPYFKHKEVEFEEKVLVFVLPGLTGTPECTYINGLVNQLLEAKLRPIVYNYRVFSDSLELKPREKVNLIDDLHFTLQCVQKKFPEHKIYGIGHSYGANQLVNYMGIYKENSIFEGGVSLGNPYDMTISTLKMQGIMNFLIAKVLAKGLEKVKNPYLKVEKENGFDVQRALKANSPQVFDDALTKHVYGYESIEEYYAKFGSVNNIDGICKPMLGISAYDDGVCSHKALPIEKFRKNENIMLYVTPRGGHIGWIEGPVWKMTQWFPKPSIQFIKALIKDSKIQQ